VSRSKDTSAVVVTITPADIEAHRDLTPHFRCKCIALPDPWLGERLRQ
jgi:hypothetical protein